MRDSLYEFPLFLGSSMDETLEYQIASVAHDIGHKGTSMIMLTRKTN